MQRAMHATVDEVGRAAAAEGIDCHWAKGGTVMLARTPVQLARARAEVAEAREYGFGEQDLRLLTAAQAREHAAATDVLGGTFTPHCAAIHPARLARGLADAVRRRGVAIYERTEVTDLQPGRVVTRQGTVRAPFVVRATEGYTPRLPGLKRAIAPVYSLMVATAPLPASAWDQIGLAARPTFGDLRHLIIYGQRTADGRLAFGGRGAPYHLGSAVRPSFDRVPAVFAEPARAPSPSCSRCWPMCRSRTVGRPDRRAAGLVASVGLDCGTGIGWAGGYVGDGVAATNLAGRTLADLITGTGSEITALPWVGHRSPHWEPEPLRWLGLNAGLQVMSLADREEKPDRPPSRAAFMGRFLGELAPGRPGGCPLRPFGILQGIGEQRLAGPGHLSGAEGCRRSRSSPAAHLMKSTVPTRNAPRPGRRHDLAQAAAAGARAARQRPAGHRGRQHRRVRSDFTA